MKKEKYVSFRDWIQKYRYLILFLLLCVFFASVPYMNDDLRWGSADGIKRLKNGFQNYGGRYFGYYIILVLSRVKVIKTIYMSAVTVGVVYYMEKLAERRIAFYITLFAIVSMPLAMFYNTISWVSGFANYMTSLFLTLIYICSLYDLLEKKEEKQKWIFVILYALLGAANALIVEHFTLLNLALWSAGMLYAWIRKHRVYGMHIAYGVGLIIGTVLMFSNSAYSKITDQKDFYRGVRTTSGIYNYRLVCEYGFFGSVFLNLLLFYVVYRFYQMEKENLTGWKRRLYVSCMTVLGIYALLGGICAWIQGPANQQELPDLIRMHAIATTIFFFALIIVVGIIALHKKYVLELALPVCSMLSTAALFVFISPVTPRCLAGSYFFELLLIYMIMKLLPDWKKTWTKKCEKLLSVGILIGFGLYFIILCRVSIADRNRLLEIRRQIDEGNKKITMEHIPYENYVHGITPKEKFAINGYKSFYHIPKKIKIKVNDQTDKE